MPQTLLMQQTYYMSFILVIKINQVYCSRFENSQGLFLEKGVVLRMGPRRPVLPQSHDVLYHPETLVFKIISIRLALC